MMIWDREKNCSEIERAVKWTSMFTVRFTFGILLLLPVGHPAGLDGFVGCIDLTYLRDSLTNIRIRVLSPGRPSLGRMPHSPYYFFRGGVHISLFCPPSTCVCMCAVNAGGCVIDLFVQGWASTSSLLCLVTGNSANTDNSPVPTSPFCIPPYQAWRDGFSSIFITRHEENESNEGYEIREIRNTRIYGMISPLKSRFKHCMKKNSLWLHWKATMYKLTSTFCMYDWDCLR